MTWVDKITLPYMLPKELTVEIGRFHKQLYKPHRWFARCKELEAEVTHEGDDPMPAVVELLECLDMLYSGKAPVCQQLRALAASSEILSLPDTG